MTIHRIAQFLRSECPRTVADFKQRFGDPRMDMANDAALEYSVWGIDGAPALDIDYVMLYANILKHQVLYVYAKNGLITHIGVVDPTKWRPADFQRARGRRLHREP